LNMEITPENKDRLKKVALVAVPLALGAVAVRNIRDKSQLKYVSYWEASQSFIIDLLEDGKQKAIRLSGTILHGPGGKEDIQGIELYEGFDYSEEDVSKLEEAFEKVDQDTN
jgi:hypothetical protein